MKMRPLLINDEVRCQIALAVAMAAANPLSEADVMRLTENVPQDDVEIKHADIPKDQRSPSQSVSIPVGYMANFSFEQQPSVGLCRHLSVSVDVRGKMPHMIAVGFIAEAFGFVEGAPRLFFIEEFEPGHHAINVVELVNVVTDMIKQGGSPHKSESSKE